MVRELANDGCGDHQEADVADPVLDAALRTIAPANVTARSRRINDGDIAFLHPVELAAVEHAVAKRRREFATGRVLLRALCGATDPIPVGADRAPVVPSGISASLAHDAEYAIAAVTRDASLVLGIDLEPATPLDREVAALVLRPDEDGIDPHLGFTLKEAAYKAWSRGGGRMIDHHEVRLSVDRDSFRAEVFHEGFVLDGRYTRALGRWIALVVARRPR
jgi:4'-phosphopantetheinyl transferase EntD